MKTTRVTIRGLTPLIMHNGRLADPIDEASQALAKLTSKRKKTIEDHKSIAKCEWHGAVPLAVSAETMIVMIFRSVSAFAGALVS